MPRTKIMQIFSRYEHYGGEEGSVYRIGDALQDIYDVEYFLASSAELLSSPMHEKMALPLRVFHNSEVGGRLERIQRIGKFDVWQIHNVLPAMSPVVYKIAFKQGIPILHYLHNYRFGCTNGFFLQHGVPCRKCIHGNFWPAFIGKSWRDSRVLSGAMGAVLYTIRRMDLFHKVTQWIAISHAQKAVHVEMGVPEEKIMVVHHFYERRREAPSPAAHGSAMFIGRLSPEKGVMQLLEAWRMLGRRDRELVIVGEGPEEARLKAYAAEHKLDNVVFTGFLSAPQQREVWEKSAFMLAPSIWMEPFGMVVLEAWANERAVIANNIGALPELVAHGKTGLLAEPFQPETLAAAMARAFDSPQECREMAMAGRKLLETNFTKARWIEQMTSIYRSMGF